HAVTRALACGRQIVLLRKGGIHETEGVFQTEYGRFAFFPTWLHQNIDWIKPADRGDAVARTSEPDELPIEAWGEVTNIALIPSRPAMDALADQHIYLPPLIDMRFSYKPHNPLYLLLVRAWRLSSPITIANTPAYAGCRSWVPLDKSIDVTGSTAALDDATFNRRRQHILDTLAKHGGGAA
ncbi:MAG: hypothetical protein JWM57_3380, partial [Phycisphaerales bacterium]|nr:hypothetical protein [Phycisphaerales bacterium]